MDDEKTQQRGSSRAKRIAGGFTVACGCSGVALGLVGAMIIVSAIRSPTEDDIEVYNQAVQGWQSSYHAVFNNINASDFMVYANNPNNPLMFTSIAAELDTPAVDDSRDVNKYVNRLKFRAAPGDRVFAPVTPSYGQHSSALTVTYKGASILTDTDVLMSSYSVFAPCTETQSYATCTENCAKFNGRYLPGSGGTGGQCAHFIVLRDVCVVFDPETMTVDTKGEGCAAVNGMITFQEYPLISASQRTTLGPYDYDVYNQQPSTTTFDQVTFTVRSSKDPYVLALRLTKGSPKNFGLGLTMRKRLSIGLFTGGGICIVASAIALIFYCRISDDDKSVDNVGESAEVDPDTITMMPPSISNAPPAKQINQLGGSSGQGIPRMLQPLPQPPLPQPPAYSPSPVMAMEPNKGFYIHPMLTRQQSVLPANGPTATTVYHFKQHASSRAIQPTYQVQVPVYGPIGTPKPNRPAVRVAGQSPRAT